ncbi:MAG TPA: DUF2970 domain-containing protein [Casimicrobiaceae bacterium]|nr:DUF2970 domain-containing protein [Casimicrobiaceae bacterium]
MPLDRDPPRPTSAPRDATLLEVAGAVFCSFFGIRKSSALQGARIRPVQVIILGVVGAAMLVLTLLLLVRVIIAHT